MKILQLEFVDFTLSVECSDIVGSYFKAKKRQGIGIRNSAMYNLSEKVESGYIYDPEVGEINFKLVSHPIFFENKDYIFDIEFKKAFERPRIYSHLKDITDKFYYRPERKVIAGTVNYGNEIGKSEITLRYHDAENNKEFVFGFEVFPTKLDYKNDYNKIIADIQSEYPLLVLDFLKKTYSNFQLGTDSKNELIWWQIFGGLYIDFLSSTKYILNKPHSRLISENYYVKAEKVKNFNVALEEEITRHKNHLEKYYLTEKKIISINTPENRFFKHALNQINRKYSKLKNYILKQFPEKISLEFEQELDNIQRMLTKYTNDPFFRSIGEFKGIRQESLVLQKATGYSSIYKNWVMLNKGMKFLDGIQKIELKNIAELYQIWCFLEMKKLLTCLVGKQPEVHSLAPIETKGFVIKFSEGKISRISFKKNENELIELFHEYQFNKGGKDSIVTYTVNQRPDIVLQLTKNDLNEPYTFTYLYDAKYRLQSDDNQNSADIPPDDAINQMHRYRDALYFNDKKQNKPQKEIIGGYILFPGTGDIQNILDSAYFKSIDIVNIGAFPLKPNDNFNKTLLKNHLTDILGLSSENILQEIIPQKDMIYEDVDPYVLAGFTRGENQINYLRSPEVEFYHMPVYNSAGKLNKIRNLDKLKYFAPIISGVSEYFKIEDVKVIARREIFPKDHPLYKDTNDVYYVFRIKNKVQLNKTIAAAVGGYRVFRYARLSELKTSDSIKDFNKLKQEET